MNAAIVLALFQILVHYGQDKVALLQIVGFGHGNLPFARNSRREHLYLLIIQEKAEKCKIAEHFSAGAFVLRYT